eukprot:3335211-Pyramimonas_sp.AAC.1
MRRPRSPGGSIRRPSPGIFRRPRPASSRLRRIASCAQKCPKVGTGRPKHPPLRNEQMRTRAADDCRGGPLSGGPPSIGRDRSANMEDVKGNSVDVKGNSVDVKVLRRLVGIVPLTWRMFRLGFTSSINLKLRGAGPLPSGGSTRLGSPRVLSLQHPHYCP